jgi:hypothetical protein
MRYAAAILLMFVVGCAATSTPYMPLEVGETWTYKLTTGKGATSFSMSITGKDGSGYMMTEPGGKVVHWRIEEGYLVLDREREVIPFFDVPPRIGLSWSLTGEDGRTYFVKVRGFEDVTVPAGKFPKCLRVEMEDEGREKSAVFHFAKDVGLVRREEQGKSGRVLIELQKAEGLLSPRSARPRAISEPSE